MTSEKSSVLRNGASIEHLVVGGGLAGLLTTSALLRKGCKVHLVERGEKLGGRYSPEVRDGFQLGAGLSLGDSAAWRAFSDFLGFPVETLSVANGGALMHSAKGWEAPDDEIPSWELSLARTAVDYPRGGAAGIVGQLLGYCTSNPNFSFSTASPVTRVTGRPAGVSSVSVGADLEVNTQNVYWCADYKTLLDTITGEGIPEPGPERVHWLKKFVKTNNQPGVVLEIAHKNKISEFTESLLLPLPAGDKEERRYVAGAFVSNWDSSLAPEGRALSYWMFPLTEKEWGDNHESMKKIRAARRILDKVFPHFDQSVLFDRVLVLESTLSPLGRKKGDWQKPLPNLTIGSDWAMPSGATFESLVDQILAQRE